MSVVRGHAAQLRQVGDFLRQRDLWPRGLVIFGEPGIGRSSLWADAVDQARSSGIHVVSAGVSSFERKMNYSGLADLLVEIDFKIMGHLPAIQQAALNRVLLRDVGGPLDDRITATALLGVLTELTKLAPVLLAIDDVQWLDPASRTILSFVTKRLNAHMGLLLTVRAADSHDPSLTSLLPLPHDHSYVRIKLGPMTGAALHTAIASRLGVQLSRPVIDRIHRVSGGNVFCAMELARAHLEQGHQILPGLPATLAETVNQRIGPTDATSADMLLALACDQESTLVELASATGRSVHEVTAALDKVEERGVVHVNGHRIRFTHPILAHGVYTTASGPRRRAMHRSLANVTRHPETRARHLALGATHLEEPILQALDTAADLATARGAPGKAAELLELGLSLGSTDPFRRLHAAERHLRSGALDRAEELLVGLVAELAAGELRSRAHLLLGIVHGHRHGARAIDSLDTAVAESGDHPELRVQSLLALSLVLCQTGATEQSMIHAERALITAESSGDSALRSQALSLRVLARVGSGSGIDRDSLDTAIALENAASPMSANLLASNIDAVTEGWAGDLESAHRKMELVVQRSRAHGNPMEVVWALGHLAHFNLWLGKLDAATEIAEQAMEDAGLIDGVVSRITALTCRAAVAAYRGAPPETERAANAAIQAAYESGLRRLAIGPITSLGFVKASQRDYPATLATLAPLLASFDPANDTEMAFGAYLPDAIEALVSVGRLAEAERLVSALETNGGRLRRPWMQVVGARGRAALLAATGDLREAELLADDAVDLHDLLPIPFERARTQLLLAQIQRRRRRGRRATDSFAVAYDAFTRLGTPIWAERARLELHGSANVPSSPQRAHPLTSTEQRVAERAASGLSNRDIAADLFISAKTVEMNLSRVYRKLGIRSRAQLYSKLAEDRLDQPG